MKKLVALLALLLVVAPPLATQESESTSSEQEPPPEGATEQEPIAEEPDERIEVTLPVPEEDGGGTIVARALDLEIEEPIYTLSGEVEVLYQDMRVVADHVVYNVETRDVVAEGDVIFDQGPRRLSARKLELNMEDKTGRFHEVAGSVSTDYFFQSREVSKTGEDQYEIFNGTFTSCAGDSPSWSFRAKRIRVNVGGYAKARGVSFRVKKAPLLYFPYLLWPVKETRTSGFLIPKPGYSTRRGPSLSLAYYQTMGRSYDTTFLVDLYGGGAPEGSVGSGNFLGVGNEFRYHPTEGTQGVFQGYAIRDPERDTTRWHYELSHESRDLPFGFRGVIRLEDVSDFAYFQDYERRGDRNSRRRIYSQAFATKNWGPHSLNLMVDNRETLVGGGSSVVALKQLPEIDYKLRSTQIGNLPLYVSARSSLHYLDVDRNDQLQTSYARGDLSPEITLPVRAFPWLSFSISAGARYTWYGDSLATAAQSSETGSGYSGESLDRFLPLGSAEIVGPSFSRIFDNQNGKRFSRFKHVIEPRIVYGYIEEFDDQDLVPRFDEIDNVRGQNRARVSLVNRLLAKPADEGSGGAREILSFTLYQDRSFDNDRPLQSSRDGGETRAAGPLVSLLRFNPSRRTTLRTEVSYNTLFGDLESTSLSGTFSLGRGDSLGVRWSQRADPETGETRNHQIRLSTSFTLFERFRLQSQVNYDFERSLIQQQRHLIGYSGSCYDLSLEFAEFARGDIRDRDIRFLVNLKSVGTFLDINGGTSETF